MTPKHMKLYFRAWNFQNKFREHAPDPLPRVGPLYGPQLESPSFHFQKVGKYAVPIEGY